MSSAPAVSATNVFGWQARVIERAAAMLGHAVVNTDPSKIDWCPDIDGRSKCRAIRAQIAECIQVNRSMARILSGQEPQPPNFEEGADFATAEEAVRDLKESAKELADVVRNLDDGALDRSYKTMMGDLSGAQLLEIAHGNLMYHAGQVNYIQMTYGDTEFRIPPEFFA